MRRHSYKKKEKMSVIAARHPKLFTVFGIFLVLLAVFLAAGIFIRSSEINRVVEKNVTVNGTVSRVWTTTSRRKVSKHRYKTVITYHASVGYEYNGRKYTNPDLSFGSSSVRVGETIRLYVDPDNPSVSYRGRSDFMSLPNILTCMIPLFLGMSFIISVIIGLNKKKKMQMMPTFSGGGNLPGQTYNNNSGFGGNYINNPNSDYNTYSGYNNDTSGYGNNSYNNQNTSYNGYNSSNNQNTSYNGYNSSNNPNTNYNGYNSYNNPNGYNNNNYDNLNTPYGGNTTYSSSGSDSSDDSWDFLNR